MDEFYVGELGGVFIFAIAGVGAMLLTGYTGLINLGQAAFLGIGAYTNAVLLARGVPFVITLPLSGFLAALAGVAIGVPTLRMTGLYLAIATLGVRLDRRHHLSEMDIRHRRLRRISPCQLRRSLAYPIEGPAGVYYMSLIVLVFVSGFR